MPYNDLHALAAALEAYAGRIAAVITEPAAANMGVVPPRPGFNALLRRLTSDVGALLIYDEVLTGFRVGPSGWWGLEQSGGERSNAAPGDTRPMPAPDLFTFGKVVGGGMPLAAIGGRAEVMDLLAPLGPVYQAGTLSGNPLATAAGITTLALADAAVYARVDEVSAALQAAIGEALSHAGVPHLVQAAGSLFTVFFGDFSGPVHDYAIAQTQDSAAFARFFHAMLDAGVALPPSGYEAWFLSAAHDDAALNRIVEALPGAAAAAGGAR